MTAIYITTGPFPSTATVTFRYDAGLVDLMKRLVPHTGRTWNPTAKTWTVSVIHLARFQQAARALGHTITDARTTTHSSSSSSWPNANTAGRARETPWAEALLRAVGPQRSKAAFRALAGVLHPDRPDTGSRELFEQLDAARRAVGA